MTRPVGIYIHIPFCVRKCPYCDFYSIEVGNHAEHSDTMIRVMESITREIETMASVYGKRAVSSIYFGGGTPSLIPPPLIERVLQTVARVFSLKHNVETSPEISMEINPGTVRSGQLSELAAIGVNRLSIGCQSFANDTLRTLGRIHTTDEIYQTYDAARRAGFGNVSLDLMYGIAGQTIDDVADSIAAIIRLNPEHVSCYELTLMEGTPMYAAKPVLPPEDNVIEASKLIENTLGCAGYAKYEISNYAKPGFECRHNVIYWTRGEYVGVGPAAHSFIGDERFANPSSIDDWMMRVNRGESARVDVERIDAAGAMFETMMLGLRMVRGVDIQAFEREFGNPPSHYYRRQIEKLKRDCLIVERGGRLFLTSKGMLLHSAVCVELM